MHTADPEARVRHLEPFFLELGKAVYSCQVFESSLCTLHALLSRVQAEGDDAALAASWDFHSTQTLGRLLSLLRARIAVPTDLDAFLQQGVDFRNQIIHRFLNGDNTTRLLDAKGVLEVVAELSALKLEVKRRDKEITKLIDPLLAAFGTSTDRLKREVGEVFAAKNPPPSGPH